MIELIIWLIHALSRQYKAGQGEFLCKKNTKNVFNMNIKKQKSANNNFMA